MAEHQIVLAAFLVFFLLHLLVETVLSVLNSRHLARQLGISGTRSRIPNGRNSGHVPGIPGHVPEILQSAYSPEVYGKSIRYALARARFGHVERFLAALLTVFWLFSGILPMVDEVPGAFLGLTDLTHDVAVLLLFILVNALLGLPLELYATFRLEARFGFNQTTAWTFWLDRLKGLLLLLALGVPFLYGLLAAITLTGPLWWLWMGLLVIVFQCLVTVLFPVIIAPLFNKFTPLREGELKTQLEALTRQCDFAARGVFVVDGSKRSGHSNAYFAGLGKGRRIALFDTLVQQLSVPELAAVLAHEIGHYKKKHILKMLVLSAALTLVGSYLLSLVLDWDPLFQAFSLGTPLAHEAKGLLVVALVGGHFTFWVGPLRNLLLRRHEYEADAYAASQAGGAAPVQSALLKIYAQNLAAPLPHPAYSMYHYSHPTLLERLRAVERTAIREARG